jgi:hypothetical protein
MLQELFSELLQIINQNMTATHFLVMAITIILMWPLALVGTGHLTKVILRTFMK